MSYFKTFWKTIAVIFFITSSLVVYIYIDDKQDRKEIVSKLHDDISTMRSEMKDFHNKK